MPQTDDYVERLLNLGQQDMAKTLLKDRMRRSADTALMVLTRAEPHSELLDPPIVKEYQDACRQLHMLLKKVSVPID